MPDTATVLTLSDDTFADVIGSTDGPVLVDFWADHCVPCRRLAPILDELAAEYAGQVTIATVNITENPRVAIDHQVMATPTMTVFVGGEPVRTQVGLVPRRLIARLFTELD